MRRMLDGLIESTHYLRNPLDVLAQQIVAHVRERGDDGRWTTSRRSSGAAPTSPSCPTSCSPTCSTCSPAATRSEEFAELRPRLVWDRVNGTLRARDGVEAARRHSRRHDPRPRAVRRVPARRHAGRRARRGDGLREPPRRDVRARRVDVAHRGHHLRAGRSSPRRPGEPGKMPFWHGDRPGRPLELGRALGAFVREIRERAGGRRRRSPARRDHGLDELAADNLLQYLAEQAEATGVVPDDRTIVVERFRDEIGDWRVCVLSPFGTPVHAPWAMAIERRLTDRFDMPVESMWGDDGIVLRLPEAADDLPARRAADRPGGHRRAGRRDAAADGAVLVAVPRVRGARRCCCHAAVPIGARRCGSSASGPPTCWRWPRSTRRSRSCSRRRASACRTCSTCPALRDVLGELRCRTIRMVTVETPKASPMAQSLLFDWIAAYMYEGDAPLAERRAAALALDRDLLRDLLGAEELRELLDPGVLADLELELQRLVGRAPGARPPTSCTTCCGELGDLTLDELDAALRERSSGTQRAGVDALVAERRAIEVVVAGEDALRRRRRCRPLPRRARLRAAARPAAAFTDPVRAPARGSRRPLRPHPRPVRRRATVGPRLGVPEPRVAGRARRARGRRAPGARRVPTRRRRARVV